MNGRQNGPGNYGREAVLDNQAITGEVNRQILRVFNWMALGLAITAIVAWAIASYKPLVFAILQNSTIWYGALIAEIAVVLFLSTRINKMSGSAAMALFFAYASLNGITFSVIFIVYAMSSISSVFFITAGTFGAMSLYGYATKKDLSGWRSFLMMGFMGFLIAFVVNLFLQSEGLSMIMSYVAVIVFVGFTAYDTQKIKNLIAANLGDEEGLKKVGVIGALNLYVDFVMIFWYLLNILGNRR